MLYFKHVQFIRCWLYLNKVILKEETITNQTRENEKEMVNYNLAHT